MDAFQCPPPANSVCLISHVANGILLVTINRPKQMNSIPFQGHWDMDQLWKWYDNEPSLRVAIITGAGEKAFCAGQDLAEVKKNKISPPSQPYLTGRPSSGFGGVSQRRGKKPIIAAVNGYAFGGGFEICLNWYTAYFRRNCIRRADVNSYSDMVIASPRAQFALPEAKRGLYASAGGLPRVVRTAGIQIASEIAMTGRRISAQEGKQWLFVNRISQTHETLLDEAVALAKEISELSPDAVVVTRGGLRDALEVASVENAHAVTKERYEERLYSGPNMIEGLAAFEEKRLPRWQPSRL